MSDKPESSKATVTANLQDFTGITVAGKTADTARLISQFGLPTVIISAFIVIFVAGLWLVRSDFLRQDSERSEAYERSLKDTNEVHERNIKGINDTYLKIHSERREDDKERNRDLKESQGKMWQELRNITEAAKEGNKLMQEATRAIVSTANDLKKITKGME